MDLWLFWMLIIFWITGLVATAYMIGKKREPITSGAFAVQVIITSLLIVALFIGGNPQ